MTLYKLTLAAVLTVAAYGQYTYNYYYPPAPGTTPWAPAWSPDGKQITVAMQGSLWNVDPGTGVATEIVYDRRYNSLPDWSPDGKWIIYTSDDHGKDTQLAILNVATGETRLLTNESKRLFLDPAFSPDGTRIAYVSTHPTGRFNIYIREIRDGNWAGPPIALTRDNRYPRDRLYVGAWDMHLQPAWTPDGKQIVFVCNRTAPLGSGDIWRMPAEADGIDKAALVHKEQTLFRTRPHVSIDGKRIVYSSYAGGADQFDNLYVLPIEGGYPYKLTFRTFDHFHPRWSPDGEKIAFISNEKGLPQLALLETYGGTYSLIPIRERRWKRPMGTLKVRVTDAQTGKTAAARIHGLAADGKFYAPTDAYARIGRSDEHSFHTGGAFTTEVPSGRMTVEAVKGFEYWPAKAVVTIQPDKVTEVELQLKRLVDMSAQGWYSGSTHSHMNYGGNLHNTLENMIFTARAEDMKVVMEQVANKDNRVLDYQHFVPGGGEHPVSRGNPDVWLHVGQEYRPPLYGHVFLLGLKKHLISPFTTGYEGTGIESLYPSNTDMFRKARAQGAVTGYVHPFSVDRDPLEGGLGVAKAMPVDAALGLLDCLEWTYCGQAQMRVWHHLLNNDIVLAPVGGEDSIGDLHRGRIIGCFRTYASAGPKLTIEGWLDALRKGNTYFTTGPLLQFRINGKLPGEVIRLPKEGGTVTLEGNVWSFAPLSKVVIHSNGRVLKEIPAGAADKGISFREEIKVTQSSWFALYAEGPPARYLDAEYPEATTNAIRVYVGDQKIRNRESAEYFVRWIDKLRAMCEGWPWWRSEQEKKHVFGQFDAARNVYLERAKEALELSR
jgi:hypothetical protein